MADLLGTDSAVAEKDRLYRCLDRLLEHKQQPLRRVVRMRAAFYLQSPQTPHNTGES